MPIEDHRKKTKTMCSMNLQSNKKQLLNVGKGTYLFKRKLSILKKAEDQNCKNKCINHRYKYT